MFLWSRLVPYTRIFLYTHFFLNKKIQQINKFNISTPLFLLLFLPSLSLVLAARARPRQRETITNTLIVPWSYLESAGDRTGENEMTDKGSPFQPFNCPTVLYLFENYRTFKVFLNAYFHFHKFLSVFVTS